MGKAVMSDLHKYLEVLELPPGASWDDVTKAYRDLIKVWHPDRFAHDDGLRTRAENKSKLLNEAVRQLRRHYRKTQLLKRSDWVKPESGVEPSVNRPGTWSAADSRVSNGSLWRHGPKVSSSRNWESDADMLTRYRNNRLVRHVGKFMVVSTVGLSIALLMSIGYPQISLLSLTLDTQAKPAGATELSDYRVVAGPPLKPESNSSHPWIPEIKPALVEQAANCNTAQLARLLDNGADVNVSDLTGDTALAWAARTNCIGGARLLLEHGANTNSVAKNGFTPKDWARWAKNYRLLTLFEKR